MFIGHNAVGFASKRAAPQTSLGWLMAAPQLLDLIWPVLLVLGIEHVRIVPGNTRFTPFDFYDYPWSHSLLMSIVWGALFALAYFAKTRYAAGATTLFFGVLSHWVLDFVTHRADMPLYPGGPKVGLGLWNYPAATVIVESIVYAAGIAIYLRMTRARDKTGVYALWSLIVFLAVMYIIAAAAPPPPNVKALALTAFAAYLIPIWAMWIDRHRETVR